MPRGIWKPTLPHHKYKIPLKHWKTAVPACGETKLSKELSELRYPTTFVWSLIECRPKCRGLLHLWLKKRVVVCPYSPMKNTALTIALCTTAVGLPQAAAASEPFCYIEMGNKQIINLTSLCGAAPVVTPSYSVSTPEVIRTRAQTKWQQKIFYR